MNKDTKIIFYQTGKSWYLPYTLHQAKYVCPETEIIVLGENTQFPGITNVPLYNFYDSTIIQRFQKGYVHMNSNHKAFEFHCFLRWFFLLEYMQRRYIDSIFYLDCDVLLYSSVSDIVATYSHRVSDCALLVPAQNHDSFLDWAVSGHVSYWTRGRLEEFCNFLIESFVQEKYMKLYQAKWDWHRETKVEGGVSDMTALYLFWLDRQDTITNLATNYNGNVFDYSIYESRGDKENEYVMHKGVKKIIFVHKNPMFVLRTTGELVRAHGIHLKGVTGKFLIPFYYRGFSFKGKRWSDLCATCRAGKIHTKIVLGGFLKRVSPTMYYILKSYLGSNNIY